MATRYTRQEFLDRLWAEIKRGKPLVMTGAGNGIAAKFIEKGGVDILGVYNTGYFRMQGYGSLAGMLPIMDNNELIYNIGKREVLPQVKEVPVIAGVAGVDPLRDMRLYLDDLKHIGYSGIHNFPTVAWYDGEFRRTLEATGLGYEHELRMINLAGELDMLSIGYAFNMEDARRLFAEAPPDCSPKRRRTFTSSTRASRAVARPATEKVEALKKWPICHRSTMISPGHKSRK